MEIRAGRIRTRFPFRSSTAATHLHIFYSYRIGRDIFHVKREFRRLSIRYFSKIMVKQKIDSLNQHFAKNQFLAGSKFTVADAYAFTVISWAKAPGIAIDVAKWPNLKAYMDRIAARPKVHEAMKAEGLIAA